MNTQISKNMNEEQAIAVIEESTSIEKQKIAAKGLFKTLILKGLTPFDAMTYVLESILGVEHTVKLPA